MTRTRLRRSERVAVIFKTLLDHPNTVIPLGQFAVRFGISKPTISEDISLLKQVAVTDRCGTIETFPGAGGGVRYIPGLDQAGIESRIGELAAVLSEPTRLLAGGFLYLTDIIFSPRWSALIGELFSSLFAAARPDCVVTVETKGIPPALMTARLLACPLVVVRRNARASEGPAVSINYVSGSADRMQTMSLPRRALAAGTRCLIIDDFMRAGGTARGVVDLIAEVGAKTAGIGVLIETDEPGDKLVGEYVSLLRIKKIGSHQHGPVGIKPGPFHR